MEKIDINKIFSIPELQKYRGTNIVVLFNEIANNMKFTYDNKLYIILSILSYLTNINFEYKFDKQHKNLKNSLKFLLSLKDNYIDLEIDMSNIKGGKSINIYPYINKVFNANNRKNLNLFSKVNPDIKYVIQNIDKKDSPESFLHPPLLAAGTFTAIYIVNKKDSTDNLDYILRLTEIENDSNTHFWDSEKTKVEILNFIEYIIPIYNYGNLSFNFDSKDYKFHYVVTKKYKSWDHINKFDLNNKQKFDFLINIIKMLDYLYKKNYFHADFKIQNISLDENLTPIFIDYDSETLLEATTENTKIKDNKRDFISTFLPKYYNNINSTIEFNMYSVGGLYQIISELDIKFSKKNIILPENLIFKDTKILYLNSLSIKNYFNLESENYNDIMKYENMIKILEYIKSQNVIAN